MSGEKKKLLVLPHLFYPDVASTAQLYTELFLGLQTDYDITVLCAVPCYLGVIEEKYKKNTYFYEQIENIKIIRIAVPEFNKNSKLSRIKSLYSYYKRAKRKIRELGNFDVTFACSQPPVLGGLLGRYSKKKNKSKLIYNIQDFNPEQAQAVMSKKYAPIFSMLKRVDKKSCKRSDLIITVGRDLGQTIENRFKGKKIPNYTVINNWVDEEKIIPLSEEQKEVVAFKNKHGLNEKFVFMYSGNLGLYYDLPNILKTIASIPKQDMMVENKQVVFVFVGEGSALDQLKSIAEHEKLENIVFITYQKKDKIIYSLNAADVHFCVNAKGIKGVSCPSKYYGIAAVAKPILAVLEKGSEIECLISETQGGLCSEPCDYEKLKENILWFIHNAASEAVREMGLRNRKFLQENLTKASSIERYKKAINSLIED